MIYYLAKHLQHDWPEVTLFISPNVMAKARNGDKSAQNNICIAYRKELPLQAGRQLDRVEWRELSFKPLRA